MHFQLAYLIPVIVKVMQLKLSTDYLQLLERHRHAFAHSSLHSPALPLAIVILPTRELCYQIYKEAIKCVVGMGDLGDLI